MTDYFDDDHIVNAVPVEKREKSMKAQYKCVLILTAIIILIAISIVIVSILIVTQSSSNASSRSPCNNQYTNDTGKVIARHPKAPKAGGGGCPPTHGGKNNKGGIRKRLPHSPHCPPDCYNNHFKQPQATVVVCSCDCYGESNLDYYESCIDQNGDNYYPPTTPIQPIIFMPINDNMDSLIDSNIMNDDDVMMPNNNSISSNKECPLLCYDEEEDGIDNWNPQDCSVSCYKHVVQFKRRFRKFIERKGGNYTSFFTDVDSNNNINTTVVYVANRENIGAPGDSTVGDAPGGDGIQYDDYVNVGTCEKYCYRTNIHRDWDPSICNDSCYETLDQYMIRYTHWYQWNTDDADTGVDSDSNDGSSNAVITGIPEPADDHQNAPSSNISTSLRRNKPSSNIMMSP